MKNPVALFLLLAASASFAVDSPVPPEHVGQWGPGGNCSGPKLTIGADSVTLANGADSQRFGNLDLCYSCEGGAKYNGKVVWIWPEFGKGLAKYKIYLNADEEEGSTKVDLEDADLKKRFPLHLQKLKKCAAAK